MHVSGREAADLLACLLATSPNITDAAREALSIPKGIPKADANEQEQRAFKAFADTLRHHL